MLTAASKTPLDGHLWHVVALAFWPPMFVVMALLERRRTRVPVERSKSPTTERDAWLPAMAVSFACAAFVHLAVVPDHFSESWAYGSFFLVTALFQLAFAVAVVVRPSSALVCSGVIAGVAMIVLWLFTRLVGVPIGPDNGGTEPFGVLDVLASAAEFAGAAFGSLVLRRRPSQPVWRWSNWAFPVRILGPLCVGGCVLASFVASRS